MNIAFASSTGDAVDQHFGWSKNFYLYRVDKEKATLLDVIDATTDIEDEHEKLSYKIGVLEEADIMYCTQIGPKASKMVQAAGIHPVRVAEGERMENAIGQLHSMLAENPPMWLLRIFHKAEARSA
jgi:nitrogen fixation protein NifX